MSFEISIFCVEYRGFKAFAMLQTTVLNIRNNRNNIRVEDSPSAFVYLLIIMLGYSVITFYFMWRMVEPYDWQDYDKQKLFNAIFYAFSNDNS